MMRYGSGLSGKQLQAVLQGGLSPQTHPLGADINLSPMHRAVEAMRAPDGAISPTSDGEFAPVVYETLSDLPDRHLLDNRFWQWLACTEFREYVRGRWAAGVDLDVDPTLKPSQQARFLGNPGLNGLGRNALSRLFWTARVMQDADQGYALTKALFTKQDLAVGVVERSFGLIPAVARACAQHLSALPEKDHRAALKRLNLRASTVSLEGASEADVRALLLE
nr:DUF6339 family protein [Terrabacter sp. MAHUQ-38]